MFVQIIEGKVRDADRLRQQLDRWMADLRPNAQGFLGTTAGITADGHGIAFARFASPDAARANSERPEQAGWWADTEKCFTGPVSFTDSSDVEELLGGGSDDAGFVQVMKVDGVDRATVERLDRQLEAHARSLRPDLLGGLRIWTALGSYVEIAYFTSQSEARAGEAKEMPPEMQDAVADFQSIVAQTSFVDLAEPWLFSA